MKRIFKAIPEAVESSSKDVAASLGLPWKGSGMPKLVIGRREWIALPDFGVSPVNAKTDSGARSSCLHASKVVLADDGRSVTFTTTNHNGDEIPCSALVTRIGRVRNSSGVALKRIFIETTAMVAGGFRWTIQLSLADRSEMLCPVLLGRSALSGYFLIDPQASHLLGTRAQLERQR